MARSGTLTVKLLGDSGPLEKTLKGVGGKLGKFVTGVAVAGGAAAAAVAVKGIQAAREAQEINRITENVIRTTGGAANVTAQQVDDLSGRLQNLTGVSDETIQRGSNMLLTFTNIRNEVGKNNDIFDQATGMALDMSVAMGTDVKDSAIQLGKALNDPIKGVSALSRVGIQFTDQQKEQIATLVESGDMLGAQKVILGELETQFGGTAEAAADPMKKLQSTIGDVVEVVGVALLPVFNTVATWLAERLPGAVETTMGWIQGNLVPAFQQLKAWWDENGPAIIAAVQVLWEGIKAGFDLIVGAVQTVIGWFKTSREDVTGATDGLFKDIKPIWDKIVGIFGPAMDAIKAIVSTALSILREFWDRFGSHILEFAKTTWDNIVRVIGGVLDAIRGVFEVFAGIFTGDWSRAWDGVKAIFSGVWDAIKGILGQAIDGIKLIIGAAVAVFTQIWGEIWERVKALATSWWDEITREVSVGIDATLGFFRDLPGNILSALGNVGSILVDAGRSILDGLWRGLQQKWESVKSWVGGLGDKIKGLKGPIQVDKKLLIPEGEAIMQSLGLGLDRAWGGVAAKLSGITAMIPQQVDVVGAGGGFSTGRGQSPAGGIVININGGTYTSQAVVDEIHEGLVRKLRRTPGLEFG